VCCGGLYEEPDDNCTGPHGSCFDTCFEGYGECCDTPYQSADTRYDPEECYIDCDPGGLWDPSTCTCKYKTPIIIDVSRSGFHLTDTAGGVQFLFDPSGSKSQIPWTAAGAGGNAFLVLDRNNNG